MNVGEAFTYMRSDEKWVGKFAIACLLAFTIIGFIPLMGWVTEITHRKINQRQDLIPDWSDFGELTITGLKMMAIGIVWTLPLMLVYLPFWAASMAVPLAGEVLPQGGEAISLVALFLTFACFFPLLMLGQFLLILFIPVYSGAFAANKNIEDGFAFKRIFSMLRTNWPNYLVAAILGLWVPGFLATFGLFLFCVGYFVAYSYGMMVKAYLDALVYLDTQAKLAVT